MGTFDRSKVSLNDKNNLIPEKDKFKLAKFSKSTNDTVSFLQQYCLNYPKNMISGHLNLNSISSKFFDLKEFVLNEIDISLISETKINSFPNSKLF